jgi:hypothetical protein
MMLFLALNISTNAIEMRLSHNDGSRTLSEFMIVGSDLTQGVALGWN